MTLRRGSRCTRDSRRSLSSYQFYRRAEKPWGLEADRRVAPLRQLWRLCLLKLLTFAILFSFSYECSDFEYICVDLVANNLDYRHHLLQTWSRLSQSRSRPRMRTLDHFEFRFLRSTNHSHNRLHLAHLRSLRAPPRPPSCPPLGFSEPLRGPILGFGASQGPCLDASM